jgi:hypothetical protein
MVSKIKKAFIVVSATSCLLAWFASKLLHVDGQPVLGAARVHAEVDRGQQCQLLGSDQVVCPTDYFKDLEDTEDEEQEKEVEEDPMLMKMPGLDFKAYRRADISSFYQEPPGFRIEQTPAFTGQAGKFVNTSPERLDLYW